MIEEVMMPRLTPLALVTSAACAFVLLSGCGTAPGPLQSHAKTLATSTLSAASARAYPVEDLLGVGPTYGEKLRKSGVKDTSALLTATDNSYRRHKLADDTGIPYPIVLRLSQSVELMKIDGVGVREANLLQAIGVESVAELAQRDVKNLTDRLGEANAFKPHFVDHAPSLNVVAGWIGQAIVLWAAPPAPTTLPSPAKG
jgi:predicted flap endonuclease-1-like 5' DNA nuclease